MEYEYIRRIGFCGVGGSGKTTIAKLLAEKTGGKFIPGVARDIFNSMGIIEKDQHSMTSEEVYNLQRKIFDAKLFQDENHGGGLEIYDRTLLDHFAYVLYRCTDIKNSVYDYMFSKVKENSLAYDEIFYLPMPHWKVLSENIRETGKAYMKVMDMIIYGMAEDMGVPVIPCIIKKSKPEKRLEYILNIMRETNIRARRRYNKIN